MSRYEFDVRDTYNVFGAGHHIDVVLYKDGKRSRAWSYDNIVGTAGFRARRKIGALERLYGARRRS